jgi:hypothetical protein
MTGRLAYGSNRSASSIASSASPSSAAVSIRIIQVAVRLLGTPIPARPPDRMPSSTVLAVRWSPATALLNAYTAS